MSTIKFTAAIYDDVVYPALATATHTPDQFDQLELNDAVSNKLEAKGEAQKDDPNFAHGQNHAPPPMYRLKGTTGTFEFSDEEAKYLAGALRVKVAQMEARMGRQVLKIIKSLED